MKETLLFSRQQLATRMSSYYKNNSAYHLNIQEIAAKRPSLEEKTLFEKIQEYYNSADKALKLLEIGCGSCDSAPTLISMLGVQEYYGVDASPFAIQSAHQKHPDYNLTVGDATQLAFADNSFDIVISNFVLEHMVDPARFLNEAIRVTCVGGIIGMIVPVCDLPWLIPSSLRYQRKNLGFLSRYTLSRWIELLRLRYQPNYYAFRLVEEPIVLIDEENYKFQPDDDLVYLASSLEITKYLANCGVDILHCKGREIIPCIANGRRPIIDCLRIFAFNCLRFSLLKLNVSEYTTTVSIVARKLH